MKKPYKIEFDLEKPDEAAAYEAYTNLPRGIGRMVFIEALLSIKDFDPREVKRFLYQENFGLKSKIKNTTVSGSSDEEKDQDINTDFVPPAKKTKSKNSKLFL